jgi:hypothetical protein
MTAPTTPTPPVLALLEHAVNVLVRQAGREKTVQLERVRLRSDGATVDAVLTELPLAFGWLRAFSPRVRCHLTVIVTTPEYTLLRLRCDRVPEQLLGLLGPDLAPGVRLEGDRITVEHAVLLRSLTARHVAAKGAAPPP